jgi:hypothetical protein
MHAAWWLLGIVTSAVLKQKEGFACNLGSLYLLMLA